MYPLIRSLLFRLDAEAAHEWTTEQMIALQQIPIALRIIERICRPPRTAARELFGLKFRSPIGIAAGFDKNALMVPMLAALGFGFIEVGTVTLRPQSGNPRPRLFRYPRERALINRMGFNNDGAETIVERLRVAARFSAPIFVNIGKNRDEDNYAACYEKVAPHADAVVINVSSPNTPGLRDLQKPEQLQNLLQSIPKRGPILVKIAPDLDNSQIEEICDVCVKLADGMICTNTTIDRLPGTNETGGLSGAPLMHKSTDVLRKVRERVGSAYPLIGVGGIFTSEDVRSKMIAGADLVQVYTSFVYEGPSLPRRLARAL
ncbi:MAG TPA: quinone-dependent dihydroorotate dehydrogenase [Thermoanaerobaculia bacterium]|jgi:dihydroorotate dehydrogenase|nr:quinone-dependent dihydroorotate dehydrogenase [Thermoanaerobaculia bacterium]